MKLKIFNEKTYEKEARGNCRPRISFSKVGLVSLNNPAAELLEVKLTDKISIAQDEDDPTCWYVFKDAEGYAVRQGYGRKGLIFNHRSLCTEILQSLGFHKATTNNFLIAGKPTEVKGSKTKYWGLIVTPKS